MQTTAPRPRPPRALAATLLLSLVAAPLVTSPPAQARIDDGEAPPLKVSVEDVVAPRYSDDLTFKVVSSGPQPHAVISFKGKELAGQDLDVDDTFSIPTTGMFLPGQEYVLDVESFTEASSGTSSVRFTPSSITSTVTPSGTTVPYSSPLYGVLAADRPTPVVPSGGDVVLRHDGFEVATYPVRTDGTFALRAETLMPGVYRNAHVFYEGDAAYAQNFFGSGMWIGDLTITPMPTTTSAALTDGEVGPDGEVDLLASVASSHPDTTADVAGELVVSAAPAGSEDFGEVLRRAYPGGKVTVTASLDDFVATHSGSWTIRTVYTGSSTAAASAPVDRTLTIGEAPRSATTTSLTLEPARTTAHGAPVDATAQVVAADGTDPTGVVIFQAGAEQRRVPVGDDGIAEATFQAGSAGTRSVTAMYAGGPGWLPSGSTPATMTIDRAPTRTSVVRRADTLDVQVAAPGSTAVPTGRLRVLDGARELAVATPSAGRARMRIPALSPGQHRLTVSYTGDADTAPSSGALIVTVPRVASTTSARATPRPGRRARVIVAVSASTPATGRVVVREGNKVVARGVLRSGRAVVKTGPLAKGRHTLRVLYAGSSSVAPSASTVRVRLR